jgi:hypothetical protein
MSIRHEKPSRHYIWGLLLVLKQNQPPPYVIYKSEKNNNKNKRPKQTNKQNKYLVRIKNDASC